MHFPILHAGLFLTLLSGAAWASDRCPLSLATLKRLGAAELEQLFAQAPCGAVPVGAVRGHVLIMTGKRMPKLNACMSNLAWKGKVFADDGSFVNQWPGFRAIRSCAAIAPSWYDGLPCVAMDYPPGTPVFGNVRDEIREIAPGLYLGRLYERCPCPRFLGYFALETAGQRR